MTTIQEDGVFCQHGENPDHCEICIEQYEKMSEDYENWKANQPPTRTVQMVDPEPDPEQEPELDGKVFPTCPICHGPSSVLGTYAKLIWHRCQYCGIDFYMGSID